MNKVSRAEKRALRNQNKNDPNNKPPSYTLKLKSIKPKTKNQERIFKDFTNGRNLLIHGYPGTGKSFVSLYLALNEIENFKSYHNVTIIRSVVPSRDMGFLPGSIKDKSKIYEMPYQSICSEIYGRGDAYDILKNKKIINFETSSFLRGLTFENTIVIVDECQNMTFQELSTIITRVGNNSKIIFCGDYRQTDLKYENERSGIFYFMEIVAKMKNYFTLIELDEEDIVRSGLVKDFIIKKAQFDYKNVMAAQLNEQSFTRSEVVHPH
jgi:predicted ribonuclease YlaK